MGTLVKEDFGRPNRDSTLVCFLFLRIYLLSVCLLKDKKKLLFSGNAAWIL